MRAYPLLIDSIANKHFESARGSVAAAVGPLDADQIDARLGKAVDGWRITVLGKLHDVSVAMHHNRRRTVAKVPDVAGDRVANVRIKRSAALQRDRG